MEPTSAIRIVPLKTRLVGDICLDPVSHDDDKVENDDDDDDGMTSSQLSVSSVLAFSVGIIKVKHVEVMDYGYAGAMARQHVQKWIVFYSGLIWCDVN